MCAVDGAGGSTASTRSAAASFSGLCGASLRSGRGASGAGPSRKKRSRRSSSRPRRNCAASFARRYSARRRASSSAASSGSSSASSASSSGKMRARLQLEQGRDEDEELAAGVEVELAPLGEVLDERDHDLGEVDLPQRQLLAEDEREQEVERPLERVEVQLELSDGYRHPGRLAAVPDAAFPSFGDRHGGPVLLRLGLPARAAARPGPRTGAG